ncbi:hypothetical protein [Mesorhizobium sp. CA7]|uniref:hypothetical protein n=1 Tax=Mesorhizobium sp. CA7 TaxID=588501 RepID=UPI001CCF954E|nr:hypothetical protein [Mesorhizobium sp. CA7]MBZ9816932.1 hypothetical protein [Mesorhizobium sp. CA7]
METQYKFDLGDWITHRDQPMPSLVQYRCKSSRGDEIYGVRSFAWDDPNRDRMIMGEALLPIDDPAWDVCLLTPDMAAQLAAKQN